MLLNASKYADPETDVVHVAWSRARVTMCGISKVMWPYAHAVTPVDCDHCRNYYVIYAIDEANSDMGFALAHEEAS